jgi:hypothetical protein
MALEDGGLVGVEADDEAGLDLDAGGLDAAHVGEEVTAGVLAFIAGGEGFGIGGFDADEEGIEASLGEELEEVGVIGDVDRSLGAEGEGAGVFLPLDEGGEEFGFEVVFVADEVIVDKKDGTIPAELAEAVEFGGDLGDGFEAWAMAEEGGDVAEIAVEGAAAGILNGHDGIATEIGEFEARNGRVRDVGEAGGGVEAFGDAGGTIF